MSNQLNDLNSPTDLMSIRQLGTQSSYTSNLIIRRNVKDVRRLASHPTLPYCKLLIENEEFLKIYLYLFINN